MHPIAEQFLSLYWHSNTWRWTFWQGVPTLKCLLDLWIYQELLWLVRPQLILDLGTWAGGSALFMAHMLDLQGADPSSRVLTVDHRAAVRLVVWCRRDARGRPGGRTSEYFAIFR